MIQENKTKSVLIISVNAIGDSLLSLSAISTIRDTFPGSRIYFIFDSKSSLLIPLISSDEFFVLQSKSILSIVKQIILSRKIQFDYAFSFFPGRINSILLSLCRAKSKTGFRNFRKIEDWYDKSQKVYSNTSNDKPLEWLPEFNFLERIKYVLKTAGINSEKVKKYKFDNIQILDRINNIILIHPVSLIIKKSISDLQLYKLIEFLKEQSKSELIIIGGKELNSNSILFKNLLKKNIIIKSDVSILELVNLIRNSKIFIAVDSFPIHIADGLNTEFLGIFGPTNPKSVLINSEKSIWFNTDNLSSIEPTYLVNAVEKYFTKYELL